MRLDCQILLKVPPLKLLVGSAPTFDIDWFIAIDVLSTPVLNFQD